MREPTILRAVRTFLVPAVLAASTAAAQNAPAAAVQRSVLPSGQPALCLAVDTDPVQAELSGDCTAALPGGTPTTNSAAALASTNGVLRARLEIGLEGATPGTYDLAPGASVQTFVSALFQDRMLVTPLSGQPLPDRVRLWLAIDGTMEEAFGLTTGNLGTSTVFAATWFAPTLSSAATSRVILGLDGSQTVDRPGATFVGTHAPSTYTGGRSAVVDGFVGSHDFAVGPDGRFDFAAFFGLGAVIANPTALPVHIVGGLQRADFFDTARLIAAQAFDARGADVSAGYRFTTGAGLVLASGAPAVVPEPSTVVLLATGLLAVAGVARARRRPARAG
ncbi:PEP-CTERM sorting domain-containing protein [Roseisolibacter sp. H3M3-2]|uniref:PEP-CTERM sorting domain-containing protein n=1 Tax=Roseisolibacter sp. H3M3-2 TaxID=3031323 RepID=UPI0023DCA1F8|nr:PEP-CTERM sorting domain-containing protein [Roseisolibacter sp. H3M3-2]MDF1502829.1 PEP-CTERM sorting domain-containing protein [Roseisolibacter sp. H3M3-2]